MEEPKESELVSSIEQKEQEKFSDLVIFTTTCYGTDETGKIRAELANKFFQNARKLGIKCLVLDGSINNPQFRQQLKQLGNVDLFLEEEILKKEGKTNLTMGESRRLALKSALEKYQDIPYFLWSEPEKDDLIKQENIAKMINQLRDKRADIIIPSRQTEAFQTLPKFQAWSEQRANKRTIQLIRNDQNESVDLWFGPKMFNRGIAQYFLKYQGKLDKWDAVMAPFIQAYQDGKTISSVDIDFKYDQSQLKNEEGSKLFKQKRVDQYGKLLAAIGEEYWQNRLKK